MDNLKIYNALKQPPKEALRQIQGGRLLGKTDINPQWRYKAMTEQFGVCGIGWKYELTKLWNEVANDDQIFAFAMVNIYIKQGETWSEPIPGSGGSMLVEKEKAGLHASDEGYKMAITDALSTAMKMLGVAADVYSGLWDGAKFHDTTEPTPKAAPPKEQPKADDYKVWLKESLGKLQEKFPEAWGTKVLVSYLKGMGGKGASLSAMIDSLANAEKERFNQQIKEKLAEIK